MDPAPGEITVTGAGVTVSVKASLTLISAASPPCAVYLLLSSIRVWSGTATTTYWPPGIAVGFHWYAAHTPEPQCDDGVSLTITLQSA